MRTSRTRIHLSIALGVAAALVAAWPARALPVAGAYPSRNNALREPNDLEREALNLIQRDRREHGLPPLEWDGLVSAVAREQAQDMAAFDHVEPFSPRLGSMEYRLHRSGVSSANARYAFFRVGSVANISEELKGLPIHLEAATHVGLGIVSKRLPAEVCVTIITFQRHSALEPFPTMPLSGAAYRLAGSIEPGYEKPMLIITLPNGTVMERSLALGADRRVETVVRFDKGNGEYEVEITAEGRLGPVVLELMRCYAGVPYPPPEQREERVATPQDLRKAEAMMLEMINRSRAEAGGAPLRSDDRLAAVARGHSQDMMRNRFFAHISPTEGDLSKRMERAGIKLRRFAENISTNSDLAAAHRGLMDSPGHRKNILSPDMTLAGVGIVRAADGQLYITENFGQEFPTYDPAKTAAELLEGVNAARANSGLAALRPNATLTKIARENSERMLKEGKLGYDRAKVLLSQERLEMKYIEMAVMQSTDPPTTERMTKTLEKRFSEVGIGVVQGGAPSGEKFLWTTVLLGER